MAMHRTSAGRAWALTAGLLAIHQAEEVAISMRAWRDRVGTSDWGWLDGHIERLWLASPRLSRRMLAQTGQCAAIGTVYLVTRNRPLAARVATSGLVVGWSAAFVLHMTVSVRTRSLMPGTVTSVVPGIPGAAWVLREIWR